MAEPLKNHFGADVPPTIADMIAAVHPAFDAKSFVRDALQGYEALSLTARGWHIAHTLRQHLPPDYSQALDILLRSSAQPVTRVVGSGMGGFLFMPHGFFVAKFGLSHFEESMAAQYVLTRRFTCEFSVRAYLIRHPEATLARLKSWATDPSEHVRRLVTEGTRPRLPWAMRLTAFQADPAPVLELLELLKDDPALSVRRSVANNLNDIGKDNPRTLSAVAKRWLQGATPEREWIVRHALRWAVKQGEPGALKALGFGKTAQVKLLNTTVTPERCKIGGEVGISFGVSNPLDVAQDLMVDFQILYIKASGKAAAKVFKLKSLRLGPGSAAGFNKKISLKEMSTRKHFAGRHLVEVLINGQALPLGSFELFE